MSKFYFCRFNRPFVRWLVWLLLAVQTTETNASPNGRHADYEIQHLRCGSHAEKLRLVFDLKRLSPQTGEHPIQTAIVQSDPQKIVIHLEHTRIARTLHTNVPQQRYIKNILCFNNTQPLRFNRSTCSIAKSSASLSFKVHTLLMPGKTPNTKRLLIDLLPTKVPANNIPKTTSKIIVLDPGHGGQDPGAIGRHGTQEKGITLKVAKSLALELEKKGHRVFLTRYHDQFMTLPHRILRARQYKADLFISLHADAAHSPLAFGSSVFVLSPKGASSAYARWLARRENQADLIGGLNLKKQNPLLASVLLDMSQTKTQVNSLKLANHLIKSIQKCSFLHKKQVEKANFGVLKAPDIPSVLVEIGFISHPKTEHQLKSRIYQQALAKHLCAGILQYIHQGNHEYPQ